MTKNQPDKWFKIKVLFFGGILTLFSPRLFAASQTNHDEVGQTAASFLEVTPSVRMAALGGDQAAAHGHIDVIGSNPAGLSLTLPELWLTHNRAFLESRITSLGFGLPLKSCALAFLIQQVDDGSHEKIGVDAGNNPLTGLGDFRYSTTLFQAGWAQILFQGENSRRVSVGTGLKGWQENQDGDTQTGWAADIGFHVRSILQNLDAGLVYKNVGPAIDGFDLPTSLTAGLAYHIPHRRIRSQTTLFTEVDRASHRDTALRAGVEFHRKPFWIRSGYETLTQNEFNESLSHFSFGGGLRVKGWTVDYAWIPRGDLGDQQRISLTLGFGLTPEEREEASKAFDKAIAQRMADYVDKFKREAEQAEKSGDLTLAKEYYSKALDWDPSNAEIQDSLRKVQEKSNIIQANRLYEEGLKFSHQGQWLDATAKWKQALEFNPHLTEAKKKIKEAGHKLSAVQAKSKWTQIYEKGIEHYLSGNYKSALTEWQKIGRNSDQFPKMGEYIEKAEKMILAGELQKIKESRNSKSDEIDNLSQQAYTLYTLGQTEKAIMIWEKILALDPGQKNARLSLAEARKKQKLMQGNEAAGPIPRVRELNAQALLAYQHGELQKASGLWKQALALDPQNIWIKNNLDRIEKDRLLRNSNEEQ